MSVVDSGACAAAGASGLRIVIVDGSAAHERHLLRALRAAGIDCGWEHWSEPHGVAALLLQAGEGFEAAGACLQALRGDVQLAALPALIAVRPGQLSELEAQWNRLGEGVGFDDFVLQPCTPLGVRARVRATHWRRDAPLSPESAPDRDGLQLDAVSHEVRVGGRVIRLTAREFTLLAHLREERGRVLSRQHLLAHVWGYRYEGGARTVDTHIGRLRLKLGDALPIETVRSNGYRLPPCLSPAAPALPSSAELLLQDTASHAAE